MDRVQQNGGTSGIIAAVFVAISFILMLSLGQEVMDPSDPAKAMAAVTQRWSTWMAAVLLGLLAVGFSVVFVTGLAGRLHGAAPTRSRAVLYLGLIGLAGFGIGSALYWLGSAQIVSYAAKDQAAATQAWLALSAVSNAVESAGFLFVGASLVVAGWAIIGTGAMGAGIGWLAVVTGVVSIASRFAPTSPLLFFGWFVLMIATLAWAGFALRAGAGE